MLARQVECYARCMPRKNSKLVEKHLRKIRPLGGKAALALRTEADRVEVAQLGGAARAEKLSSRRRSQIAKNAALARWASKRQDASKA